MVRRPVRSHHSVDHPSWQTPLCHKADLLMHLLVDSFVPIHIVVKGRQKHCSRLA